MFSEPVRKEAMTAARDSGKIIISGKVTLVQETDLDVQNGFLMYLPVYKKKSGLNTPEKRKEAWIGFVYSPFRMNDLMNFIPTRSSANIDFSIYDGEEISAKTLMYQRTRTDSQKTFTHPDFSSFEKIDINGRTWTLKFSTLPSFEATIDKEKPLIVLIGGILISALFFVVARTLTNTYMINRKLEQILESTMEGIYGIDEEGKCTFINRSAAQMLGYIPDVCLGRNLHEVIHHSHADGSPYYKESCPILDSIKNKKSCVCDTEIFWRSDGTSFPVEYSSYPVLNGHHAVGAVVTFTDITERKKAIEQIETSLAEKEILLKEIHHRVKNNLQIISSILNLQSYYITDKRSLEAFNESKNRVRTMALIHEKLYRTESISRLNLKEYIQELVSNLFKSYNTGKSFIESEICVDEIFIVTEVAIPLGLIINEIVTNSLKHAFLPDTRGKIYINIKHISPEKLKIVIGDNGRGLPEDFDYQNTDSLGLKLVSSLISQLEGEILLKKNEGTEFTIYIEHPVSK
jgi:PAS domain S-box-containing protein